jgi:hypothetical protein
MNTTLRQKLAKRSDMASDGIELARQQVLMMAQANHARYQPGQRAGHYESFFLRANHPTRPLAFWIRYTLFSPDRHPENAIGELWAVFFNGENGRHVAVKREVPFSQCSFKTAKFGAQIDDARLEPGQLHGATTSGGHTIAWDLAYSDADQPLFLLPLNLYPSAFPKAKSLVGLPRAVFDGTLSVDGQTIEINDWVGSQNHNWGQKHTDLYAWGQVAGFDNSPDSFLEVATARLKIGPVWTPFMTPIVLRHQGQELALNTLWQTIRAQASFSFLAPGQSQGVDWRFRSETERVCVEGRISAPREAFVGLSYRNPPGGVKHCLNTKLAACELTLTHKRAGQTSTAETLTTRHRAAFEILTDDRDHGVPILA